MRKYIYFLMLIGLTSCNEKLLEKPDNLIDRGKMVQILADMAIANAAVIANKSLLENNNFRPTEYVLTKYGIDSAQFVDSDRYYASIPMEYESIYQEVESKLDQEKKEMELAKKLKDSLHQIELKEKKKLTTERSNALKDSLP
ncbi:MAG: DUF4296 domain-containing protein [Maribacter sp.]|nr:DUF4296 domain-containing protein [Maribacter sp.]